MQKNKMWRYLLAGICFVSCAHAHEVWSPGTDRWQLSNAEAIQTLIKAGAPPGPTMVLWAGAEQYRAGWGYPGIQCIDRYIIADEPIALMVFGRGRVAYDLTVPNPYPLVDDMTLDCWDHAGNHILRPDVCGNWWYQPPLGIRLMPPVPVIVSPVYGSAVGPAGAPFYGGGGYGSPGIIAQAGGAVVGNETASIAARTVAGAANQQQTKPEPVPEPSSWLYLLIGCVVATVIRKIVRCHKI